MGDPFKKVRPGEALQIPAETFNTFLDAARDFKARQRSIARTVLPAVQQADVILVKNVTAADRARFEVVGLGNPVIEPDDNPAEFQNAVALEGQAPAEKHRGLFAILLEPVSDGRFARALVSGVTPCQVKFPGNGCRWADLEPGQYHLYAQEEHGAAQILWSEDTCDELRWAVVRLSNAPEELIDNAGCKVCVTTTLPPCDTGNCKWVWDPDAGQWFLDEDNCDQGCACHEPQYCGSDQCEVTTTDCTSGQPQVQPTCPGGTTTTTTTSGPTTTTTTSSTTPCPSTSTTQPPSCTSCDWFCHPVFGWVLVSNGCLAPFPCLPCPIPSTPCNSDCSSASTSCGVAPPPTSTTQPPPCSGTCHWVCDGLGNWVFVGGNCSGGTFGCGCGAPTFPCASCGAAASTPCVTPTTQPPPSTTTFDPCQPTPPPPTTTPNPCNTGGCVWKWSVVTDTWFLVSDDCPSACPCPQPPYDGADCESASTGCLTPPSTTTSSTTTSSTTTTSTSTTSTTSTTTTPPPWYCAGGCEGPCLSPVCSQTPCFNCAYSGPFASFADCMAAGCPPSSTTTTTTTTTTSGPTTPPP